MALSRAMKNLMHDSAQARRGGGNPSGPGGGMGRYNPGPKLQRRGPMPDRGPRGPVLRSPGGPPPTGGPGGMASKIMAKFSQAQRGGGMMQPNPGLPNAGGMSGKPRPGAGTFGFASQGGGGTPALQQAKLKAKQQSVSQQSRPSLAPVGPEAGARTTPHRGRMAGAFGTGGSRRYMR